MTTLVPPAVFESPRLRAHFDRPRLREATCRVLLLTGDDLEPTPDLECAMRARGHSLVPFSAASKAAGDDMEPNAYVSRLLRTAADVLPDFVLSLDFTGLDHVGSLEGLFAGLGIPLAVWFRKDPRLTYWPPERPTSGTGPAIAFVADRAWEPFVRQLGFTEVVHLPLGVHLPHTDCLSNWYASGPADILMQGPTGLDKVAETARALAEHGLVAPEDPASFAPEREADPRFRPLIARLRRARGLTDARRALAGALDGPELTIACSEQSTWANWAPSARLIPPILGSERSALLRGARCVLECEDPSVPSASTASTWLALGLGAQTLCPRREDLDALPQDALLTYGSFEECVEKARWLASHRLGDAIPASAREQLAETVRTGHGTEHRIDRMVESLRSVAS